MTIKTQQIRLKNNETVQCSIIAAPEPEWAERLIFMLSHKGNPWNWQNDVVLQRQIDGLNAFFYILHRDGKPFANIMTIERDGVGIFGHVWTDPKDRQKGASSQLMQIQMEDFSHRKGRALYLTTGNDVARKMYERFGFREIAPTSGLMAYIVGSLSRFEDAYFGKSSPLSATIHPLDWRHWPAACPLFMGSSRGVVRNAGMEIIGRGTPEGPFLPFLKRAEEQPNNVPEAMVLELENGAVAGLASWAMHPLWPDTCMIDLYCHDNYWSYGEQLLNSLVRPAAKKYIAYADSLCIEKHEILRNAGYTKTATLPHWLTGRASDETPDLVIFTQSNA